jgi:outer membrane murein-binding lipoprotein Lpp
MLDRISLTARVDRLERQIEQLKTLGTRPKLAAETTEAARPNSKTSRNK